MSKIIPVSLLALVLLTPVFAAGNVTTPQPVLDWYGDVISVMSTLVKDLDNAKDAKTAVRAFTVASATIQNKQIAARRDQLESEFTEFFAAAAKDSAWVAPAEWVKMLQDFNSLLQKYTNTIAANTKVLSDSMVVKAMEEFGTSFQSIDSAFGR